MAKTVKLADIAEIFGVSTVTVSKALSGKKGVSEEMRERIVEKARELGYKQPSVIRREQQGRSYTVAVLMASRYLDQYTSFYWKMYQELAARAAARECITSLEIITDTEGVPYETPKLLSENLVDGYIILGPVRQEYLDSVVKSCELPFVYLDGADRERDIDCVVTDNFYGMYRMTDYLLERGHRRIAFVGSIDSTESILDRYYGYHKALHKYGIPVREDWVIEDRDPHTGLAEEYEMILPVGKDGPTAFACNCDRTAGAVIELLKKQGKRVPEDYSVVGFDNYLYPGLCDVPITTYEVDMREMVSRTLYILRKKIEGEYYKKGVTVIGGRLVEKESVGNQHQLPDGSRC